MSRLGIKVTVIASIALAIAFGMYLFIYEVATPEFLFSRKFNGFWVEKQNAAFQSFQAYVSERELTIQAAIEDINWEINYPTMHPHLERYNSENAESYGSEEYDKHKIQCSDGIIYAFFYPDTGYYYNISFVIAVVIAAICFFSIFFPTSIILSIESHGS